MITPNELRIGNWVVTDGGFPFPIERIYEPGFANYSVINPIPLTGEILKMAGFEVDNSVDNWRRPEYTILDKNGFKVGISNDSIVWYNYCNDDDFHSKTKEVKYVHQLQNLYFAITDNELIFNI